MIPLPLFRREKKRVIYDPETHDLYTRDGRFLKHIECPLAKNWEELQPLDLLDRRKRYCYSCSRSVYDFTNLPEWLMRLRLWLVPEACIHFATTAQNLAINASAIPTAFLHTCPYRTIREAVTDQEKETAVACPFSIEGQPVDREPVLFLLPSDLQKGEKVLLEMNMGAMPGSISATIKPFLMLMLTQATWDGAGFDIPVSKAKPGFRGWWEGLWLIG